MYIIVRKTKTNKKHSKSGQRKHPEIQTLVIKLDFGVLNRTDDIKTFVCICQRK